MRYVEKKVWPCETSIYLQIVTLAVVEEGMGRNGGQRLHHDESTVNAVVGQEAHFGIK